MANVYHNGEDEERAFRLYEAFLRANPMASPHAWGSGIDWLFNKDGYRTGYDLKDEWIRAVHSTEVYRSNLNVFDHEKGFLVPNEASRRRHRVIAAQPGGGEEQWRSGEFKQLLERFGLASKYGGVERSWYGTTTHLIVVGKPDAIVQLNVGYEV